MKRITRGCDVHDLQPGHKKWQDAFAEQADRAKQQALFTSPLHRHTLQWTNDSATMRSGTITDLSAKPRWRKALRSKRRSESSMKR